MKRLILFISLLITLTSGQAILAQGADSCEFRLGEVYLALANAQITYEAGNEAAALEALANARRQIEIIEAQCAGDEVAQESLRTGGSIVIYLPDASLSKLNGLAFANGIELSIAEDSGAFMEQLQDPQVVAAIYGSDRSRENVYAPSDRILLSIEAFVSDGGHALLMYDRAWVEQTELLQDLFEIAIANETLMYDEGTLRFADSILPPWLQGMRIGVEGETWLTAYVLTPNPQGFTGSIISQDSGRERIAYYETSSGSLSFMPRTIRCVGWQYSCVNYAHGDWLDDRNIDFLDNEEAAIALLRHLSGG